MDNNKKLRVLQVFFMWYNVVMHKIEFKDLTWIDIKAPTEDDLLWVKDNFKLHPLVLKELLPHIDHPKIEKFDDYLFIVLF